MDTAIDIRSRQVEKPGATAILDRKILGFFFILTLLCKLIPGFTIAMYFVVALNVFRGPKSVIESLTVLFILNLGNSSIFSGGGAFRHLVMFCALISTLIYAVYTRHREIGLPIFILGVFVVCLLPINYFTSMIPTVSVLKVISFAMGTISIMMSFQMTNHLKDYWIRWFSNFFIFLLVGSIVLLFFGMGYERNGSGFQGITGHPQVMGSVAAIMAAWFSGLYFFKNQKTWIIGWGAILSWIFIFQSGARTGLMAAAGGLFITLFVFLFLMRMTTISQRVTRIILFLTLGAMAFSLVMPGKISGALTAFMQKDDGGGSAQEIFEDSRGGLIAASLNNFYDYPLLGIGMGVPTDYSSMAFGSLQTTMGIPTSASVEKGFMPSAVLEETGLFGAIFVVLFISSIFIPISAGSSQFVLWVFCSSLLINGGEAVFFSLGGKGLLFWIMVGFCFNQMKST